MTYTYDYVDDCVREDLQRQTSIRRLESKSLTIKALKHAIILPMRFDDDIRGGVIDAEYNFIPNTGFHVGKEGYYDISNQKIAHRPKTAIYLGYFNRTWGHCFTDNMKLLWIFVNEIDKISSENSNVEYVYTCDKDFFFSNSFKDLLQLVGVDLDKLTRIDEVTCYDLLLVPEACFYTKGGEERYYTKEYVALIDKITEHVKPLKADNIYLTRTKLKHGRDTGEKGIEKVFKSLGYKIISPELLDLRTQIAYIKGCKTLATTEGSISHNAVFMSEGACLEIIRKTPFINEYQIALNEIRNLNVTYIDAHLSVFARKDALAAGPFFIYVNDNVIRFSGRKDVANTFSLQRFKEYTTSCVMLPHLEQRVLLDSYYYKRASEEIERKKQEMKNILNKIPFLSEKNKSKIIALGKKLLK